MSNYESFLAARGISSNEKEEDLKPNETKDENLTKEDDESLDDASKEGKKGKDGNSNSGKTNTASKGKSKESK